MNSSVWFKYQNLILETRRRDFIWTRIIDSKGTISMFWNWWKLENRQHNFWTDLLSQSRQVLGRILISLQHPGSYKMYRRYKEQDHYKAIIVRKILLSPFIENLEQVWSSNENGFLNKSFINNFKIHSRKSELNLCFN